MNEIENKEIIESTVRTWMSDENVTVDAAVKEGEELTKIKVSIMVNMLEEAKRLERDRKSTLKDLYANKIVFELLGMISSILSGVNQTNIDNNELKSLISLLKKDIEELKKDKKTIIEVKKAIMRLIAAGTLQCNSRINLLLQLLDDKRVSIIEYYNHEMTMAECSSSGITYISNKDVEDKTEEINKNIKTLKLSLGMKEE